MVRHRELWMEISLMSCPKLLPIGARMGMDSGYLQTFAWDWRIGD